MHITIHYGSYTVRCLPLSYGILGSSSFNCEAVMNKYKIWVGKDSGNLAHINHINFLWLILVKPPLTGRDMG